MNGDITYSHGASRGHPLPAPVGIYLLLVRTARWTLAVLAVLLGLALIAGGPARFGAPSMYVARQVPGEHVTWGAFIAAAGLAVVVGKLTERWPLVEAGMFAIGLWCWFFAVTLAVSALREPKAALTGLVVYGGVAFLATAHGTALRFGRRKHGPQDPR